MKRLAIYAFKDKDGIVDDYVFFFLKALKEKCEKVIFVTDGKILPKYNSYFDDLNVNIYYTESFGSYLLSYQHGLKETSDCYELYDEIILCNNTLFGPVYPLDEMLLQMESKNVDFWSVAKHLYKEQKLDGTYEDKVQEFIYPYFLSFNKKVFLSDCFISFFGSLNEDFNHYHGQKSFDDFYSIKLLDSLLACDFKFDTFIPSGFYGYTEPTFSYPCDTLKKDKCPFLRTDCFLSDYGEYFNLTEGQTIRDSFEFVTKELGYDESLIYSYLLRVSSMSNLRSILHLNYILPSCNTDIICNVENRKIALIMYVYYKDAIDECLEYAFNLPKTVDLYFVYCVDEVYKSALTKDLNKHFKNVNYVKKINKGRDVTSYLIDCREVFDKYDYICYLHDKRSPQLGSAIKTRDFFAHCMNSILGGREYVKNIISLFESNKHLGLLVPPPLSFGDFFGSEFYLNPGNKKHMLNLIDELGLNVPFDDFPVAPYGDFFWVRAKSMKKLFNKNWSYEKDIPSEPLPVDGTILHAVERIIPFVVQSEGFYSSWILSDDTARTEVNNQYFVKKQLLKGLFKKFDHASYAHLMTYLKDKVYSDDELKELYDKVYLDTKRETIKLIKKKRKYLLLNAISLFLIPKLRNRFIDICNEIKTEYKYRQEP